MNNIEIRIDKRIELVSVLLLLTGYEDDYVLDECKHNKEYRQEIFDYFKNCKNKKAVVLLEKWLAKIKFGGTGVVGTVCPFALLFDDNWNFHVECDEFYNKKHWLDLSKTIKTFVEESGFEKFYANHKTFYQSLIDNAKDTVQIEKTEKFLTKFYGEDFANKPKHILNLTLIITNVGYGLTTYLNEDFCIFALNSSAKRFYFIGAEEGGSTAVHEFSHPIINPLVDKYCNYEKDFYSDIKDIMQQIGYPWDDPAAITIEHIARSLQVLFLKTMFKNEPKFALTKLDQVVNNAGFKYAPLFVTGLESFYKNKRKYKNFEEYLPILLNYVKNNKDLVDKIKPL